MTRSKNSIDVPKINYTDSLNNNEKNVLQKIQEIHLFQPKNNITLSEKINTQELINVYTKCKTIFSSSSSVAFPL